MNISSYSPNVATLNHIAVWKKTSRCCEFFHPRTPPCFSPVQFSPHSIREPVSSFPVFVQKCPSSKIYTKFLKDTRTPKTKAESWQFQVSHSEDSSSPVLPLHGKSHMGHPLFQNDNLSSIYNSRPVLKSSNFDKSIESHPSLPYSIWPESNLSRSSLQKNTAWMAKSTVPNGLEAKSLALRINLRSWEATDYQIVKWVTSELNDLIKTIMDCMDDLSVWSVNSHSQYGSSQIYYTSIRN